jgi:hypothetical protein
MARTRAFNLKTTGPRFEELLLKPGLLLSETCNRPVNVWAENCVEDVATKDRGDPRPMPGVRPVPG